MNISNSSPSPLPQSAIDQFTFGVTIFQFGICFAGFLMNLILLCVMFMSSKFQKHYDKMLGTMTLLDAIGEIGSFLPMALMAGNQRIPLNVCFFLQCLSLFAGSSAFLLIFTISLDRVFAVFLPILYQFCSQNRVYIRILLFSPTIYGICLPILCYWSIQEEMLANKMVNCQMGDPIVGLGFRLSTAFNLPVNIATGAAYVAIFLAMKMKIVSADFKERVNLSLALIISSTIFLWFLSIILNLFLVPAITDPAAQFLTNRLSVLGVKLATAINLPIIYATSSEYRKLIKNFYKNILGRRSNIITNQGHQHQRNTNNTQIRIIKIASTNINNQLQTRTMINN